MFVLCGLATSGVALSYLKVPHLIIYLGPLSGGVAIAAFYAMFQNIFDLVEDSQSSSTHNRWTSSSIRVNRHDLESQTQPRSAIELTTIPPPSYASGSHSTAENQETLQPRSSLPGYRLFSPSDPLTPPPTYSATRWSRPLLRYSSSGVPEYFDVADGTTI